VATGVINAVIGVAIGSLLVNTGHRSMVTSRHGLGTDPA